MANLTQGGRILLPFALHGLAREVDQACGVLLHTSLDLQGFVGEALRLVAWDSAARQVLTWSLGGGLLWLALGAWRARQEGGSFEQGLAIEAHGFGALLLRPALTVLALLSLAIHPTYPYGFTLPVALTQDWGLAQDAAALAAPRTTRYRPFSIGLPEI